MRKVIEAMETSSNTDKIASIAKKLGFKVKLNKNDLELAYGDKYPFELTIIYKGGKDETLYDVEFKSYKGAKDLSDKSLEEQEKRATNTANGVYAFRDLLTVIRKELGRKVI